MVMSTSAYIEHLLNEIFSFCDIRNNQRSRCYQPSRRLRLITIAETETSHIVLKKIKTHRRTERTLTLLLQIMHCGPADSSVIY